jgi:hypothetical protein
MKVLAALLMFLALLAGCRDSNVDRFVGTWHRPKYPNETITIKDEGDGKISITGKPWPYGTEIGHVKGDTAIFDAMTTATFKADGTLVFAGSDFVK